MKRKYKKIKYAPAPDLDEKARKISGLLFPHIKIDNIACLRSYGSKSHSTIARCHALGKVMQLGMKTKAFYTIEFISERFDKMTEKEQEKTIIHELMHIPKSFGGGFRHHDFVCQGNVDLLHQRFERVKNENKTWF